MACPAVRRAAQILGEQLNGQINRFGKFTMPQRGPNPTQDGQEPFVGEMTVERVTDGQSRLFRDGVNDEQRGMFIEPSGIWRLKGSVVQQPECQLWRSGGTRQDTEIHRKEDLRKLALEVLQAVMEEIFLLTPQAVGRVSEGVQTCQVASKQLRKHVQVQSAMLAACRTFSGRIGASWAFHEREII